MENRNVALTALLAKFAIMKSKQYGDMSYQDVKDAWYYLTGFKNPPVPHHETNASCYCNIKEVFNCNYKSTRLTSKKTNEKLKKLYVMSISSMACSEMLFVWFLLGLIDRVEYIGTIRNVGNFMTRFQSFEGVTPDMLQTVISYDDGTGVGDIWSLLPSPRSVQSIGEEYNKTKQVFKIPITDETYNNIMAMFFVNAMHGVKYGNLSPFDFIYRMKKYVYIQTSDSNRFVVSARTTTDSCKVPYGLYNIRKIMCRVSDVENVEVSEEELTEYSNEIVLTLPWIHSKLSKDTVLRALDMADPEVSLSVVKGVDLTMYLGNPGVSAERV